MRKKKIAVFDFETDPFEYMRVPKVFAAGFYDGDVYKNWWGDDSLTQFIAYLDTRMPLLLYAHNGGKFDFHFMLEHKAIQNPLTICNGRILKATCGNHELRDSFAAVPVALSQYHKDVIDITKFERPEREKHKDEILSYLKTDCTSLYSLINKFVDQFGRKLTVGAAALTQLKKMHPFDSVDEKTDTLLRPYYIGGRVQPFQSGKLIGDWKIYDVNSMYPYVMSEQKHPIGKSYFYTDPTRDTLKKLMEKDITFFATIVAESDGALPFREKNGLFFPKRVDEYQVTSHELKVGIQLGLVNVIAVTEIICCNKYGNFSEYVYKYVAQKILGKENKDKALEIFAKLLLNSAYGKTGQDPNSFYDWHIAFTRVERPSHDLDFTLYQECEQYEIWRKPSPVPCYHNVGIAASVTGAARAVLLRGLHSSTNVAYCDTDSIICESLDADLHPTRLGAWDCEAQGDELYIGGKKMYSLYRDGEPIKKASKGAKLSNDQIKLVCEGEKIKWDNAAPSFSIKSAPKFISREIKKTV